MKKWPWWAWLGVGLVAGSIGAWAAIRGSEALSTPAWTEAIAWQGWAGGLVSALVTVAVAWLVFRGTVRNERERDRAAHERAAIADRRRAIEIGAADVLAVAIGDAKDRATEIAAAMFRLHALAIREESELARWAQTGAFAIWREQDVGMVGWLGGRACGVLSMWLNGTLPAGSLRTETWDEMREAFLEKEAADGSADDVSATDADSEEPLTPPPPLR